jgi:hypothetical protein
MTAMSDLVATIQSRATPTALSGSTVLLNGIVSAAAAVRTDAAAMSAIFDDIQANAPSLAAAVVSGSCEAARNIQDVSSPFKGAPEVPPAKK